MMEGLLLRGVTVINNADGSPKSWIAEFPAGDGGEGYGARAAPRHVKELFAPHCEFTVCRNGSWRTTILAAAARPAGRGRARVEPASCPGHGDSERGLAVRSGNENPHRQR
jgi:hypothetical protein